MNAAVRLLDALLRLRQRAAEHGDFVAVILLDQRIRAALAGREWWAA